MSTGVFKLARPVLTEDYSSLVLATNEKGDVKFQFELTPEWYQLFDGKRTMYVSAEYNRQAFKLLKVVGDREW